jgi:putative flippase GtrA
LNAIKKWAEQHPELWEKIKFVMLSGCATLTNFVVMWICTGLIFKNLNRIPFSFLIFNYTDVENDLGLCGFLSFLIATTAAQTVNFIVQKKLVFESDANSAKSVPKYAVLVIVLILISAALPAFVQPMFIRIGVSQGLAPTLANLVNIFVQMIISYPAMKYLVLRSPEDEKSKELKA